MDALKLKYEMKRRNVSVDDLCNALAINKSTFYRKCKGTSEFTLNEITQIVELLKLQTPMGIFFAEEVS